MLLIDFRIFFLLIWFLILKLNFVFDFVIVILWGFFGLLFWILGEEGGLFFLLFVILCYVIKFEYGLF